MFSNIGRKIKKLAKVTCWLMIMSSIVEAVWFFASSAEKPKEVSELYILLGIACLIVGPFFAWIGSFTLYGFGELVDKTCRIEKILGTEGAEADELAETHNDPTAEENKMIVPCPHCDYEMVMTKEKYNRKNRIICPLCGGLVKNTPNEPDEPDEADNETINFVCPHCRQSLTYKKWMFDDSPVQKCPKCDRYFSIKRYNIL